MRRAWLFVGVLLLSTAPLAQEPSTPPVFRGGTEVVQLDVSVLDRDRMPIQGLTAADFTVLVDGEPQPIVAFDAVNLPTIDRTRAAWTREVAPDVATNRQDAQRVVVILLDNCGTRPDATVLAKHIAHEVVRGLGPADRAAVIFTGWRTNAQEFTTDHALLGAAIDRFTSLTGAMTGPSLSCAKGAGDSSTFEALRNTAAVLESATGSRKSLVVVSATRQSVATLSDFGVLNRLQETLASLQRSNINVYQFDPNGLETSVRIGDMFGEFADNTGGRAIANTNTPETLVPQMYRENSSYYVLGIEAGPAERRERFRRVEVKVSRPDVEVRARSGFFTRTTATARPPRNPPTPLERALSGGLPDSGLPMTLVAAPFANPNRRNATVLLVTGLDAADLPSGEQIELDVRAFRTDWREAARAGARAPIVRRDGASRAEFSSQLTLPPGRYEVRAGIRHPRTGRTGSAFTTLVVPEFGKDALTMSGVVLSAIAPGAAPRAAPTATLPDTPTTAREFSPQERLEMMALIYQGGRASASAVDVSARVVDDLDRTVFTAASSVAAASFGPARQTTYRLELPIRQFTPGDYLLVVEATAGTNVTNRKVRFSVRDGGRPPDS